MALSFWTGTCGLREHFWNFQILMFPLCLVACLKTHFEANHILTMLPGLCRRACGRLVHHSQNSQEMAVFFKMFSREYAQVDSDCRFHGLGQPQTIEKKDEMTPVLSLVSWAPDFHESSGSVYWKMIAKSCWWQIHHGHGSLLDAAVRDHRDSLTSGIQSTRFVPTLGTRHEGFLQHVLITRLLKFLCMTPSKLSS